MEQSHDELCTYEPIKWHGWMPDEYTGNTPCTCKTITAIRDNTYDKALEAVDSMKMVTENGELDERATSWNSAIDIACWAITEMKRNGELP